MKCSALNWRKKTRKRHRPRVSPGNALPGVLSDNAIMKTWARFKGALRLAAGMLVFFILDLLTWDIGPIA